jgi:hypothetical protein
LTDKCKKNSLSFTETVQETDRDWISTQAFRVLVVAADAELVYRSTSHTIIIKLGCSIIAVHVPLHLTMIIFKFTIMLAMADHHDGSHSVRSTVSAFTDFNAFRHNLTAAPRHPP